MWRERERGVCTNAVCVSAHNDIVGIATVDELG